MTGCWLLALTMVRVGEMELKTYPFSDPDPVPATAATRYPYFRYDGSTHEGSPAKWKTVVLENDRVKVTLLPEVGGKIWGATDKVTGRDFLYVNHVMKFRDIAMRGPWLSGGIEYNFGILGHAPSSSTSVDWFVRTNADGSASCFVSSPEYITRTLWQVEVRLGGEADEFETHVTWYNASGLPSPYYHWMNAAYSVRGNPEFLFPGRNAIGHEGEIVTENWPYDDRSRKLDVFEGNRFGGPKSYHVLPGHNGFYGIWWPDKNFGSYHRSEPYEKFGRKIWLWALSREGGIWEDLLTDEDGQYAELQSGRCFNQPRWGNYRTPFKHPVFSPGATETFVERWGPIRDRKDVAADIALERDEPRPRPVRAPEDFNWDSAWGEYVRGTQFLRERHDAEGAECLRKAIAKDRFLTPAYGALAAYEMRRGNLSEVHALCGKALEIDAYDPEANYLDGFAWFLEGDLVTARERLGVASLRTELRSASLALVARSYLREGRNREALAAAEKGLDANASNFDALLVQVVAQRGQRGVRSSREKLIRMTLERLPLFHAVRYEAQLDGMEDDFGRFVRNELPAETYLELGYWYAESGLDEDARTMFTRAGDNILAKAALGDWAAAKRLPVAGVFPFRREQVRTLSKACEADGHWKFRYLLGVLKGSFGFEAESNALLDECGDVPDEAVFYQYRASRRTGAKRLADLRRAKALGDNWRLGRQFVEHYEAEGDFAGMLRASAEYTAKFPMCNPLQIAHGRALLKCGRHRECLDYLKGVKLLPSEHRDSGTDVWQAAEKALGLELTWPENLGKGRPFPAEEPDNRQYEFRAAHRDRDVFPVLEDFEQDTGWTVEATDSEVTLSRSREQQCFGRWTLKLTNRATGEKPVIRVRPRAPMPVSPEADTIGVWMWFDHFGRGANKEPDNPNGLALAVFADADGKEKTFKLGNLSWRNWHVFLRKLPKGLKTFNGFLFNGCTQKKTYEVYIDDVGVFREDVKTPFKFRPSPKRNLKPLRGMNPGINTGTGTLPFPTREETSMPSSGQPEADEPVVRFTGGAVKGPSPEKLVTTTRRVGRTLIVDLYAPAGAVTEVSAGFPSEAKVTGTVDVPYLVIDYDGKRLGVDMLEGGFFRLGFFDWYRSNASRYQIERDGRGCALKAVYLPNTAGEYNEVSERLFITLSPKFEEVLPTVANPVSPYKPITGKKLWRVHAAVDPAEDRRFWKIVHRYGMREVVINDHETQWRDKGESFTLRLKAAPGKGGDDWLVGYSKYLRETLGFTYGPYNNYTDLGSASAEFRLERVSKAENGDFRPAWMRCWALKPAWAPEACDTFAPQLKNKFGFDTAYCDVHTASHPWGRTDYDARVPGASTLSAVFYSYGEVMLLQKRHWQGPVYSEGGHQMFYMGLTDGNYAQDLGFDFNENPWILDFDLRKLHDLECSFGMGAVGMFSRPKTPLEKMYYQPHAPTERDRDDLVDRFLGCTAAYGHTGFLVMDWCFEPYMKPFGRAYGAKSVFNPDNDYGIPRAMRSYYMIQQAASRYTQATAREILYFDADGTAMGISEALVKGVNARCQVAVSYSDGTYVVANRNADRLRTKVFGRVIDLPANGYSVWTDDGEVYVEHGDRGGKATLFDYAESPAYLFIDGRGTMAEGRRARSQGTAVCRVDGDGWEVIPFHNVPCAFKVAAEKAVALDVDGKVMGPAELRKDGEWRSPVPVPGAFSYRLER